MSGEWRQQVEAVCYPRFSCSGDGGALLRWQQIHKPRSWRKLGGPAFPRGQWVAQWTWHQRQVESRAKGGDISKEGLRAAEERDHREGGRDPPLRGCSFSRNLEKIIESCSYLDLVITFTFLQQ